MPEYILHLADIHIGSGPRSLEYRDVFKKDHAWANSHDCIVVIAGDIFHHKIRYSGVDIEDFNVLVGGFARPVIIIPGNHDINMNDLDSCDLITPLVLPPHVHYWRNSGRYTCAGLKFYHISVCGGDDHASMAQPGPDDSGTILLYHGFVNGAICYAGEVTDALGKDITSRFALTLLGDIHNHHFITQKCAYSGSLIQQNVAEALEKGGIVWDIRAGLGQAVGKFIRFYNDKGFIRLDLRGKTDKECQELLSTTVSPNILSKLTVITDADDTRMTGQINMIKNKFGRVDKVSQQQATAVITNKDISAAMSEILRAAGADEAQIEDITRCHTERLVSYNTGRWHVVSLRWDNMYKYGMSNFIDFTHSEQISGIIADNTAGKSSVIDILVFGLFGEHLRGDKKMMINHAAKSSYIRVDFIASGVLYYMERKDTRGNAHSKISFCRQDGATFTNITGVSITETYAKIKRLIGTLDQFLATGLYYDSRNDITRMLSRDRMKLLPELFGLVDNESIVREMKTKITNIRAKLSGLVKPRIDDPVAVCAKYRSELGDVAARITSIQAIITALSAEINEHTTKYAHIRPLPMLTAALTAVRGQISQLKAQKGALHIEQDVRYAEPIAGDKAELKKSIIASKSSNDIKSRIATISAKIDALGPSSHDSKLIDTASLTARISLLRGVISGTDTVALQAELDNITSERTHWPGADLNNMITQRADVTSKKAILEAQKAAMTTRSDKITSALAKLIPKDLGQISTCESSDQSCGDVLDLPDHSHAAARVALLESYNGIQLTYNKNCAQCCHNMTIIPPDVGAELARARAELGIVMAEIARVNANNIAVRAKQAQLATHMAEVARQRTEFMQWNDRCAQESLRLRDELEVLHQKAAVVCSTIAQYDTDIQRLSTEIASRTKIETAGRARASVIRAKLSEILTAQKDLADLSLSLHKAEEHNVLAEQVITKNKILVGMKEELAEAQTALCRAITSEFARATLHKIFLYEQYILCRSRDDICADVQKVEKLEQALMVEAEKAQARPNIDAQHHARDSAVAALALAQQRYGELTALVSAAEHEVDIFTEYHKMMPGLQSELSRLSLYVDCITSPELKTLVVRKNIDKVATCMNSILAGTGFTISAEVISTELNVFIVENGHRLPLSMGSGFQKFIISIAFRLVLTSVLPAACEFIMIDEGFGYMSAGNRAKLADMFTTLAYKFIFIITQIDDMQNIITRPIAITTHQSNGVSYSRISTDGRALEVVAVPVQAIPGTKIQCQCGALVTKKGMAVHCKTAKHCKILGIGPPILTDH
jgi:DNA repair exonuclease SbcCD ATPase subunit